MSEQWTENPDVTSEAALEVDDAPVREGEAVAEPTGEPAEAVEATEEPAGPVEATEEPAADPAATDADGDVLESVDPVQAFKDDLASRFGDWYVVHSYAGYENRVKANLENRIQSLNMEDYIF